MTNRLDFFRQQMAAFEGTADPQKAIECGYYIPQPKKSLAETIATRIALRTASTHLLIGGIGSGKTTQLLVACDRLNEIEDISAHYIDVSLYTDISEIKPGVLIAISAVVISEFMQNSEDEKVQECRKLIHKYAYGYEEKKQLPSNFSPSSLQLPANLLPDMSLEANGNIIVNIKNEGILSTRKQVTTKHQELIRATKILKEYAFKNHEKITFIFDGLDRFNDAKIFLEIINNDLQILSEMGLAIVLVAPIICAYSEYRDTIEQAFNYNYYQHCFDIYDDPEAHLLFEKILKVRSSEGFIEPLAIEKLIYFSGGVVRDLINLTQSAIEEAYLSDSDNVQISNVEKAVDSFGRSQLFGVSDQELGILEKTAKSGQFIPRSNEDIQLLITRQILEYQYPKRRYAVHPTIIPLIQKTPVESNP